ncbi:uncharacterized protein LOC121872828 [Homarus americanus]|nr:uncharacterized protein LOC121872828 [Homarus americanus]XP_042231812.1 uncharacterized protein LOC121872828 [Homarus americanus]
MRPSMTVVMVVMAMMVANVFCQEDNLVCTEQEETDLRALLRKGTEELYLPLLEETASGIRTLLSNQNTVRFHLDCVIHSKECTRIGKSLQHLITDNAGGELCYTCQPCQKRRIQHILKDLRCNYKPESDELEQYVLSERQINIYDFFQLKTITC